MKRCCRGKELEYLNRKLDRRGRGKRSFLILRYVKRVSIRDGTERVGAELHQDRGLSDRDVEILCTVTQLKQSHVINTTKVAMPETEWPARENYLNKYSRVPQAPLRRGTRGGRGLNRTLMDTIHSTWARKKGPTMTSTLTLN